MIVPKGSPALLLLTIILSHRLEHVDAKNDNRLLQNFTYQISDICKRNFMQDLYRKIDGAVLTSKHERDLDCAITFQTHSILQRFMLRFDQLQLDCNDHLYIYDGAHAVGSYKEPQNAIPKFSYSSCSRVSRSSIEKKNSSSSFTKTFVL
ncbi:hypothetical protein HZH66_013239 [Vespula vulgaris]|uniref:Uncharacterized protein n=1 Tax=Vespula vulgaris TaxID=7454 RepID=A0A834J7F9_VESVU|nr:hypothetical protein HZH66_013239 [Vespula vulgaris]